MKIKLLLNLTIALFAIALVSCDENLDQLGSNIQPGGDNISVYVDTVVLTAKTVSLEDSVYARSSIGLLGEYTDPVFGKIKADFLSELYCPENLSFHSNVIENGVDSVFLDIISYSFHGDSVSPIGISAYRIDKKFLDKNFFTNVNPTDYCSKKQLIGQGIFTIKDAQYSTGKRFRLVADKSLGIEFLDGWKDSKGAIFKNSDALREFFKGIYVTTTFGSGSLIEANASILQIYYSYTGRKTDDSGDSTYVGLLRLPTTSEVLQLNQVQNSTPSELLQDNSTRTYLKSPAGLCTELTIPLKDIIEKANKGNSDNNKINNNKLNSATFSMKGFTEEEEKIGLKRSRNLLFINKDSLPNFLKNGKMADSKSSFIMEQNATNNSYNFSYSNLVNSTSNNLATMINYYVDYYKDKDVIPDLKFLIIPVSTTTQKVTSGYSTVEMYTNVYNQMTPTSAILRTDKNNMKMGLIFSNYNTKK